MAGVTGRQGMLIPPRHLFPPLKGYYIAIFPGGKMARGKGYYTTPVLGIDSASRIKYCFISYTK
jgi:hypothetical protein